MSDIPHPNSVGVHSAESIRYSTPPDEALVELELDGTNIDAGVSGRVFAKEKRGQLGWFFWLCVAYVGLNLFVAAFAPVLPVANPAFADFTKVNLSPSWAHWFGTDDNGRDILSRVVWGARTSITIGLFTMLLAYAVGATLGMFAAYRRGRFDTATSSGMFVFQAFPGLVLVIALTQFWVPINMFKLIISIALVATPLVYRVIRASTISSATREYVTAAKMQGATDRRIISKELLPNIAPTALSFFLIGVALVIGLEGALAFIGLSLAGPSWGNMINEASGSNTSVYLTIFPVGAFCFFLMSLNFIGDRLRSYFDVTEIKL